VPTYRPDAALIVQADGTVLAEVAAPGYARARQALLRFAVLEAAPEHVHTFRVTPLSLWHAAAAGVGADEVEAALREHARHELPPEVLASWREAMGRYGRVWVERGADGRLALAARDVFLAELLARSPAAPLLGRRREARFELLPARRGEVKAALVKLGWPVDDRGGHEAGVPLPVALREATPRGTPFALRPHQRAAADAFLAADAQGAVVLPPGAGKTLVALAALAAVQECALVLCADAAAARQWQAELLDKTTLRPDEVGEYSSDVKEVRPVTVATYEAVAERPGRRGGAEALLGHRRWGLVVLDDVHRLPAALFPALSALQDRRRLALGHTLAREDGREGDAFALVGPLRHTAAGDEVERPPAASCHEIRVPLPPEERAGYLAAGPRERDRVAAENRHKVAVVAALVRRHAGEGVLVLGTSREALERIAADLRAPLVTAETPPEERAARYGEWREGAVPALVLCVGGAAALELPDAGVCVQVSGSFGSRQEEAQRLGRLLRPRRGEARFYTVVSRDTEEQTVAAGRRLFLAEQGYRYRVEEWDPAADGAGDADVISLDAARARRG
jgi:DNA excision repair protein ERCC-3